MRFACHKIFLNLGLLAIPTLASLSTGSFVGQNTRYEHPQSYYESRVNLNEPEQFRIQKHLATVEADLRLHTPAGLTVEQKKVRAQRLDALHEYWTRGEFPKNRDYPDSLVPYFIDAEGVPCAVGYLVIVSGHKDFAEEIVRKQNHAYIREIKDARLALWAKQSGLTLEECARIQPSYSGPTPYPYITKLKADSQNRIWIIGQEGNSFYFNPTALAFWATSKWNIIRQGNSAFQCLCVGPADKALAGSSNGISWNGGALSDLGINFFSCDWSSNSLSAWAGSNRGLIRYVLNVADSSISIKQTYDTSNSLLRSNSISVVATSQHYVWAGTLKGLAALRLQDSTWSAWDSTALSGVQVTGLALGNVDTMWAGVDAPVTPIPPPGGTQTRFFSGKGLLWYAGQGNWVSYKRSNSMLPSDTIEAIAPKNGKSLWIACASGFYEFTPPMTLRKAANPLTSRTTTMSFDGQGQLYVGTWGSGVYRMQNDSLIAMGYPVVPILAQKATQKNRAMTVQVLFNGQPKNSIPLKTLSGRRVSDENRAAGVYVIPR